MAAFSSLGSGFLSNTGTNPRDQKKQPTGGSIHAGQYTDTSPTITGNPNDGIGFSSPTNASAGLWTPPVAPAPDPEYMPKTSQEWKDQNEARGIADTHDNMGSLAVDFRESEAALTAAGKPTVTEQRDTKILDTRAAEEHKRTITDPAAAEAHNFRMQAKAAKDLFKSGHGSGWTSPSAEVTGKASSARPIGGPGSSEGVRSNSAWTGVPKAIAPTSASRHGVSAYLDKQTQREAPYLEAVANAPTTLLKALGSHSKAPNTQPLTDIERANKQSASGAATAQAQIQQVVTGEARRNPNK